MIVKPLGSLIHGAPGPLPGSGEVGRAGPLPGHIGDLRDDVVGAVGGA